MVRDLIISEFSGTREKIYETDGIKNINELQKYAESRGFIFVAGHDKINLTKGTVSITVPIPPFQNELSMSIVMASIREKLTKAKH